MKIHMNVRIDFHFYIKMILKLFFKLYKMELPINVPIEFDENSTLIKKIIKDQGCIVCRDIFDTDYINFCLKKFTNGFIILGKMNYSSNSKYIIKAFILFTYYKESIQGHLVCSRESYKGTGFLLMNCVKNFALKNEVTYWEIKSLPEEKLLNFYENFGFSRGNPIYTIDNIIKNYSMYIRFDYINNTYEIDYDMEVYKYENDY